MGYFNYTPELSKAKKKLFQYMKDHNLSFDKDYRNDPIHGKAISLLLLKLNKERDKIIEDYPIHDQDNNRKFVTLKTKRSIMKKVKKAKESQAKEATELKEKKVVKKAKVAKEKKEKTPRKATKYNYPLIDGREMNASEKKKYRMEQRKLAAGEGVPAKEKKESKSKKATPKKDKKKSKKEED